MREPCSRNEEESVGYTEDGVCLTCEKFEILFSSRYINRKMKIIFPWYDLFYTVKQLEKQNRTEHRKSCFLNTENQARHKFRIEPTEISKSVESARDGNYEQQAAAGTFRQRKLTLL